MPYRDILFVADSLTVGGAERVLVGLAAGLVGRGNTVTIAASAGGSLAADAAKAGIDVAILGPALVKRRADPLFAAALGELVRARRPQLVHTHMYASTVAAAAVLREIDAALVVHEHSEAAWRDDTAKALARIAYRRADAIVAVSDGIAERLQTVDGVDDHKIRVVPNGAPWPSRTRSHSVVPRRDGPTIGTVARLTPEKGVGLFLAAAAEVAQHLPQLRVTVVGDGPERDRLQQMANHLHLRAEFAGMRLDAPALLASFDVAVVSSFSEGTPLVVLEAMAAGVPLVATAVGGIPTQVRHGIEALLVAPGDASALAQACRQLLTDKPLARRLARAATRRLRELPGPAAQLDAIEAVYDRALAKRAAVG